MWGVAVRQNAATIILKRPVLTVVTTIQPHTLKTLASNPAFTGRGLTARFAYSIPADVRGYRNVRNSQRLDLGAFGDYRNVMSKLLTIPHEMDAPRRLLVEGVALDVFHDFAERIEFGQREDGEFEDMRGWASKAASTFSRLTGSPQLSSTIIAMPPQRSTFSFMRPPKTPFWHTMTVSPGDTRFTKQASIPAEPGAEMGRVSAFWVWKANCSRSLISSISCRNRGSRCPMVGRASAPSTRGETSEGPGPIKVRWGG